MPSRRIKVPVEGSWRFVDGENDSFDTSVVPSFRDDDLNDSFSFSQASPPPSGFPSQVSSQEQISSDSQDSIQDFARHQEDDNVILREPFRPSIPASAAQSQMTPRTPDPQFRMPLVDVDSPRRALFTTATSSSGLRAVPLSQNAAHEQILRKRGTQSSYPGVPSSRSQSQHEIDNDFDHTPSRFTSRDLYSSIWSMVATLFLHLQRAFVLGLAIYLCYSLYIFAETAYTTSPGFTLSPMCRVPGVSRLNLPICPTSIAQSDEKPNLVDFSFDELIEAQGRFEHVMKKSVESVSLPLEMSLSERSVRDLRITVRTSKLPIKNELDLEFDGYITFFAEAVEELRKFNTHIGSTLESIIRSNKATLRGVYALVPDPSQKQGFVPDTKWTSWVFYPFQVSTQRTIAAGLIKEYHINLAKITMDSAHLLLELDRIRELLGKADDHIEAILRVTATYSPIALPDYREQIFLTLWAFLNGRQAPQAMVDRQSRLLKHVDRQRTAAVARVAAISDDLKSILEYMLDLAKRYSDAGLVGNVNPDSLSAHMDAIERSTERLEMVHLELSAEGEERVQTFKIRQGITD